MRRIHFEHGPQKYVWFKTKLVKCVFVPVLMQSFTLTPKRSEVLLMHVNSVSNAYYYVINIYLDPEIKLKTSSHTFISDILSALRAFSISLSYIRTPD